MASFLRVSGLNQEVEGMQGTVLRRAASWLGRLGRAARLTVACVDGDVSRLGTNITTTTSSGDILGKKDGGIIER
jgi:hypothetical protein